MKACNEKSATTGFKCAINEFADETHSSFNGARLRDFSDFDKHYSHEATHDPSVLGGSPLPKSLDWSTSGATQAVRNQVRAERT